MNPHDDTSFLDGAPATHPRFVDSYQQHNESNPSEGATALQEPYTSHLHTPQNLLNEALQPGFTGSPQPRNLDNVSTWGIDRIREVAMYFSMHPEGLHIFDLQDDPNNDSDDGDEEELGAHGGMNLEHDPRHADPAGTSHAPLPSGGAGSRGRRLRMYIHECPPQSDPHQEMRRKMALRQLMLREQKRVFPTV